MIFHFWPIAGLVLVVQTLRRRYRRESSSKPVGCRAVGTRAGEVASATGLSFDERDEL